MRLLGLTISFLFCLGALGQGLPSEIPWDRGSILLDEGFEKPISLFNDPQAAGPDGWIALGGQRSWQQTFEPDYAQDGQGGMVLIEGRGDCGEAVLKSPLLSAENPEQFLVIAVHSMKAASDPDVEIFIEDEDGHPVRRDSHTFPFMVDDAWNINVFRPCDLPPRFRVGLFVPPGCNSQTFDNLKIGAFDRRETRIVQPEQGGQIRLAVGEPITFVAETEGDNTSIQWAAFSRDAEGSKRLLGSGLELNTSFDTPGFYTVSAIAIDAGCPDRTPEFRDVMVVPVRADIVHPQHNHRRPLVYNLNESLSAVGDIKDPKGLVDRVRWLLDGEPLCTYDGLPISLTCETILSSKGKKALTLQAMDAEGTVLAEESRILYVDPSLAASLIEPAPGSHLELGKDYRFSAEVLGEDAGHEDTQAFWIINGEKVGNGPEVIYVPDKHGPAMAIFVVRNATKQLSDHIRVPFFEVDPNHAPKPQIISPHSDWQIPEGGSLFFDSSFRDTPEDEQVVYWEIENVDTETLLTSGEAATLGKVTFSEEGTYQATLYFRGRGDNEEVSTRMIKVTDLGYEDNDDQTRAATLGNGRYQGLTHDRPHFYEVHVAKDGDPIRVSINVEQPSKVVFYPSGIQSEPVGVCVSSQQTLQLRGLPAGTYTWGVISDEDCGSPVGKKSLSFSFNISVLNPALYFTDLVESGDQTTELGIVNPNGELAEVEIIGYDATGAIVCKASREIPGSGALRDTAGNLFGENAEQVVWARVDSTVALVGFSRTCSVDEKEAYATTAATLLYDEIYVPHIAKDTQTWYTRAAVVNGQDSSISSQLITSEASQTLQNTGSYSKDSFDFSDRLGTITENNYWATFSDGDGKAALAGTEVFGTNGSVRQVVGLSLAGSPASNPNFTNGTDRLYFTHITQGSDFWTGLALVNRGAEAQGAIINVYGTGGIQTGTGTLIMGSQEKKVMTAQALLAEANIEATDVQWMEVLADTNITGYELFGTLTGGERLAGLEAINEIGKSICMPFIDATGDSWHGISVVNVDTNAQTVSFKLYNEAGNMIACVEDQVLAAKEKKVYVLSQLFNGLPDEASWLKVEGSGNLVGFELIGNVANEHMSALIAQ